MARNIYSIIPHGVGGEASFSLGQNVIRWRETKTTGDTLRKKVIVRQFAQANNRLLASDISAVNELSTDNNMEIKREVEQKKMHQMAKVHDILEKCQSSQNL